MDEVSSSSCVLCLPDSLTAELTEVAKSGFWYGFEIGSALLLGCGCILIAMYLINRGAGH